MKKCISYSQYLLALSTFVVNGRGYLCFLNENAYSALESDRLYKVLMRRRNAPNRERLSRDIEAALKEQTECLGYEAPTLSPTLGSLGYLTEGPGIEGRRKWLKQLAERSEAQ